MQGRYESWVLLMEALLISGVFLLRQLSRAVVCRGGSRKGEGNVSREKYRQPLAYLIYLIPYGPVALC